MNHKIAFLLLVITLSFPALAAPKLITCTNWDNKAAANDFREQANSPFWQKHMKKEIPERLALADYCETAEYGDRMEYSLDTDDLSKEVFDLELHRIAFCGLNDTDVERKQGTATNSVISIILSSAGDVFNIDRASLEAGYGTERNYTCLIEDIKRNNQI